MVQLLAFQAQPSSLVLQPYLTDRSCKVICMEKNFPIIFKLRLVLVVAVNILTADIPIYSETFLATFANDGS